MSSADVTRSGDSRRTGITVVLVVSGLALIAGIALVLATSMTIASFGWFAYAPLSGQMFVPGPGVQPWMAGGLLLAGFGLLGVGFGAGWLLAVRRRDPRAGA